MRQNVHYTKLQSLLELRTNRYQYIYKYTLLSSTYKNNTKFFLKIIHSKHFNRKDAIAVFSGIFQAVFDPNLGCGASM